MKRGLPAEVSVDELFDVGASAGEHEHQTAERVDAVDFEAVNRLVAGHVGAAVQHAHGRPLLDHDVFHLLELAEALVAHRRGSLGQAAVDFDLRLLAVLQIQEALLVAELQPRRAHARVLLQALLDHPQLLRCHGSALLRVHQLQDEGPAGPQHPHVDVFPALRQPGLRLSGTCSPKARRTAGFPSRALPAEKFRRAAALRFPTGSGSARERTSGSAR